MLKNPQHGHNKKVRTHPKTTRDGNKEKDTQFCVRTLNVELDHKIGNEKITPASD